MSLQSYNVNRLTEDILLAEHGCCLRRWNECLGVGNYLGDPIDELKVHFIPDEVLVRLCKEIISRYGGESN